MGGARVSASVTPLILEGDMKPRVILFFRVAFLNPRGSRRPKTNTLHLSSVPRCREGKAAITGRSRCYIPAPRSGRDCFFTPFVSYTLSSVQHCIHRSVNFLFPRLPLAPSQRLHLADVTQLGYARQLARTIGIGIGRGRGTY